MDSGNPIKEENLKQLRSILRQERTATKSRLAELSGLSVVTIQSLTKILLELGEIKDDSIIQPQLGRPAVSYAFNERARLALVIYMYEKQKKDTAAFLVCDLYGDCIEHAEQSFSHITVDSYNDMIELLLARYPNIDIIALGMPIEEINGKILISDYSDLLDMDFAPYLHNRFGVEVFLENDINAATYGYCNRNNMLENTSVAGIYMPSKYPPGAGLCRNGELIKGKNGFAGEVKYLPFDIRWETFGYKRDEVEDYLIKVMKVLMCIYNPEKIVLYCEQIDTNIIEKLKDNCRSHVELLMLADIEVKKELKEDFETGMINLALNRIL